MGQTKKLWNKNFNLVVIGQIISLFGNSILRFVLSLHVLSITGSAAAFATVSACSMIPLIILSPFGGILADRQNRKNMMVILDTITAVVAAVFSFFVTGSGAVAAISVLIILLAVIQSFYTPVVQSSVPLLMNSDDIVKGNAVVNQVMMLANLLGPVLGGILYGMAGVRSVIWISAGCFAFSALLEVFIRIPFEKRSSGSSVWNMVKHDIQESTIFVTKKEPGVIKTVAVVALFNLFLTSIVIIGMPYIINIVLGMDAKLYGYAQGGMSAAGLIGGIIAGVLADKLKVEKAHKTLLGTVFCLMPVSLIFLVNAPAMAAYIVATLSMMGIQALACVFTIVMMSEIQKRTPEQLLGKVTAFIMMICMCAQPVGQAIYGILFDRFSDHIALLFAGACAAAIAITVYGKKVFTNLTTADVKEAPSEAEETATQPQHTKQHPEQLDTAKVNC